MRDRKHYKVIHVDWDALDIEFLKNWKQKDE